MKNWPGAAIGWVVSGMALMGLAVWILMPRLMLLTYPSRLSYEETVAALGESLAATGQWRVLVVNDYRQATAAYGTIEPTGSVNICNPAYAARILAQDEDRGVTAFMPLSIGVYTDRQGRVFVSRLNVGLVGTMFGGTIAEVMRAADSDLVQLVDPLVAK